MKYSESEIINALKVIKETCKEVAHCNDCLLSVGKYNLCGIRYDNKSESIIPGEWKIIQDTPKSLFLH